MITVRPMPAPELERMGELDRSEHVTHEHVDRTGVQLDMGGGRP